MRILAGECTTHPQDAQYGDRACYLGGMDVARNAKVELAVDEEYHGLQIPGENGRGHLDRPWRRKDGEPRTDDDDDVEPDHDFDVIARRAGRRVLIGGRWKIKMDATKAKQLAKKALPCPFCGSRLTVKDDRHGCWVAHKDEIGGECIVGVVQILNEEDLAAWNKRKKARV